MLVYILFINLLISGLWCQDIERVVVPQGQPFSFECQQDESVYFGRQLNDWREIQENNEIYLYLNLNFVYLNEENIIRVTSESAESKHAGFYACRKATWTSTNMNSIYQLILADVQSFYWTYICHGPIGSCQRSNDEKDENLSTFEVADQTDIELFCCASVTGYKNVNIYMNRVGDTRGNIDVIKKQELDGSWVICANQWTKLNRTPYFNPQTLTCELLTDDRHYSTLSSVITVKGADPIEGILTATLSGTSPRTKKLTTGGKVAIILGSVFAGLILLGLSIFFIYRHKKASSSSKMRISKPFLPGKPVEQPRYKRQPISQDVEPAYEEPTELTETTAVFVRC